MFFYAGVTRSSFIGWVSVLGCLVGCTGLIFLLPSLIRRIKQRWLRIGVGWTTALATATAAPLIGLQLLFSLLVAIGIGVTAREVAPDGRSVLVTQDGFDGDSVDIYTEYDEFHCRWYRSAPELAGPRTISDANCSLDSAGNLLLLTCGQDRVTIDPGQAALLNEG